MSVLLAEPFLLASYLAPSYKLPKQARSEQRTHCRHVNATCCSKSNGEVFVTICIQGDGIHVLELSSMHAVVSHTLGPSTYFAAPAATRFDGSDTSTSYAVIQSAPDGIGSGEHGRIVWRWRDQHTRRPQELPEPKHSSVFPQVVDQIWAPSALPWHIIAVSPSGQTILADQDLKVVSIGAAPGPGSTLLRSWLFESGECTFLPHIRKRTGGMVVLCFIRYDNRLDLWITLVQPLEGLTKLLECDVGLHENVAGISCDPSGYTSVLTQEGKWDLYRLSYDDSDTVSAVPLADTLQLSELLLSTSSSTGSGQMYAPTLLSIGPSYVLLASIVGDTSPEIVILLWDLQFSVVLASQTITMPSTVTYTPKRPPSLELVSASKTQALLVLSQAAQTGPQSKEGSAQRRSIVFVVPFEVPLVSTIALAMGKARDTQKWLKKADISSSTGRDESRSQMMQLVLSAVEQGRMRAAEVAFFDWVEEETTRLERAQEEEPPVSNRVHLGDGEGIWQREHKTSAAMKIWKMGLTKPALSHHFVSSVLNIVLRPMKSSEAQYPSKIALYLVDRKAVGHSMVEGGLIPALRDHNDWESIFSALRNVSDIPEEDLVALLTEVVKSHRRQHDSQEDGSQVAEAMDMPPLTEFLAALVDYKTSPSLLHLALKHHLNNVRDIVSILEILEGWIAEWCGKSFTWAPKNPVADAYEPIRKKKIRSSQYQEIPSFENVTSFLQSMLDTHFLVLLQYSASHGLLERLAQHLKQLLASVDEMDLLRGPLESFIRMEARGTHRKDVRKEGGTDWRKKRKEAIQAAELVVGLYQMEEIVL